MSDTEAVLFANEAFYNAFRTKDFDALQAIWSSDEKIACIHPGWLPIYGRDAVMKSWKNILTGPNSPDIFCHGAAAHFLSDTAYFVTCFENLAGGTMSATNIFLKEGGSWRIVHHHASPTIQNPPSISNDNSRLQ
ncbi:MAG: DUF4440 domain-containing protein [Rhodospirillaceae bacterium]|nr:DUF4440 domain-containing protein [Rhodospirillaceae bacterium]|tara:strand:- start:103 stop:507 length:405 start_codon:yes stop_codon:yes gene_type:complete